ncbi:ABC transporter ATP-binding protein [Pusillimonas sp. ANT_WB101]|uniref:ABC transporter ATP-binding protein n=1 Tax=Pusillimonas sp. ANT_WB101 TaxID=2597356 RepID=UPI0011ED93D0|nr:ABC transporter ATP-binding protein [Pusillimonas sp. ANT_WB101]KAA0892578.1 ABC transporter ATP-binding protein [Pusillimonas sp. ANT_WB101]
MSAIQLKGISKAFGGNLVVHPTDLQVESSELVTLLGPSGSGKSTLLSMIAGLLTPTSGQIFIEGRDVTNVPPAKRNLGMVFQNYALFPHMTVFDNVAFPLSIRKLGKKDIDYKVKRALEMVRLDGLGDRKQSQLSGGQQQRVALARALVFEPEILLLDEPLGALDKKLREEVQLELRQLQRDLGVTTILVTHDQEEALSLSTRVVVLNAGQVQQIATPEGAYRDPENKFVAEFIGIANLWHGKVTEENDSTYIKLPCGERLMCRPNKVLSGEAHLLVRPEHLEVHEQKEAKGLNATVTEVVYLGQTTRVHMRTEAGLSIVATTTGGRLLVEGQAVRVSWKPENACLVPA